MKIIAVANQKGGCGKTTSTANIGARLNELGYRVLMVDLDPQSSLTTHFGYDSSELPVTISNAFDIAINSNRQARKQSGSAAEVMADAIEQGKLEIRSGLTLLPADILLEGIDNQLVTVPVSKEFVLKKMLDETVKRIGMYDYVLIDCRPTLSTLTINALTACERVVIPLKAQFLDFKGFNQLYNNIELIRDETNPKIKIQAVFLTMFDGRIGMSKDIEDAVGRLKEIDMPVCSTKISQATALADASQRGQDIFTFHSAGKAEERKKSMKSVAEYTALVDELIKLDV